MSYNFVSLTSQVKTLEKHLREQCGIEPESSERDSLIEQILTFEELNNLERPYDLLPDSMKNQVVEAVADIAPAEAYEPVSKQKKVRLKIFSSERDKSDVYVAVNEYDCKIQRDEFVEVPYAVYQVLMNSTETHFEQQKDGTLLPKSVPSYNIQVEMPQ
ncbi:TPA: hypothetical protein PMB21_001457 [Vibrio cholerae]|nr:hypothetical protein [Vibrio cholerae]